MTEISNNLPISTWHLSTHSPLKNIIALNIFRYYTQQLTPHKLAEYLKKSFSI